MAAAKVTAAEVAQKVFDAAAQGQFIYSHPQALASVQTRMEDVLLVIRNPTDPFAGKPEFGRQAARGFAQRRLSTGSAGRAFETKWPLAIEV